MVKDKSCLMYCSNELLAVVGDLWDCDRQKGVFCHILLYCMYIKEHLYAWLPEWIVGETLDRLCRVNTLLMQADYVYHVSLPSIHGIVQGFSLFSISQIMNVFSLNLDGKSKHVWLNVNFFIVNNMMFENACLVLRQVKLTFWYILLFTTMMLTSINHNCFFLSFSYAFLF